MSERERIMSLWLVTQTGGYVGNRRQGPRGVAVRCLSHAEASRTQNVRRVHAPCAAIAASSCPAANHMKLRIEAERPLDLGPSRGLLH